MCSDHLFFSSHARMSPSSHFKMHLVSQTCDASEEHREHIVTAEHARRSECGSQDTYRCSFDFHFRATTPGSGSHRPSTATPLQTSVKNTCTSSATCEGMRRHHDDSERGLAL